MTKEVAKLEEKRGKLSVQLKKLFETINGSDYVTKVPENIRNQNSEKVPTLCFLQLFIKLTYVVSCTLVTTEFELNRLNIDRLSLKA